MTSGDLRAIHGDRLRIETRTFDIRDIRVGTVAENGYELVFLKSLDGTDLDNSSTVGSIQARRSSKEMHTGC